jgi:dihydrofolate reductase/thymidylate synthase
MSFTIIVATDVDGGIGLFKDEAFSIPWKNSIDMKFFKDTTSSKIDKNAVIMGRNTYESLPVKKLPDRTNIVLTSNPSSIDCSDIICESSLDSALNYCFSNKLKPYVIGGSKLYEEALNDHRLETILWNIITETNKECNINFPISFKQAQSKFNLDSNYELSKINNENVQFYKFNNITSNTDEANYLKKLKQILTQGDERQTRNSITKSIFGERLVFDLKDKFPLLTTKKMFLRGIFEELLWFLRGQTDSKILEEKKVNIWKGNSTQEFIDNMGLPYREGDVGNMYGFQLNHAGAEYTGCDTNYTSKGFNQIEYCLNLLKNDKYSRRILMTTYVPHEAGKGVLYPCHGIVIQFYVKEIDGLNYLSCHMYQRSADMFLGVPFNIASYALLVNMICHVLNNDEECSMKWKADKLVMSFGDLHIYEAHYEQVKKQTSRRAYMFPQINFKNKRFSLTEFEWEDVEIINYNHHSGLKAKMIA